MLENFQLFFARTPEGEEERRLFWEDYKSLIVGGVVFLFIGAAFGLACSMLSDAQTELAAKTAKYDTCEAARKVLSDQSVDFEKAKLDRTGAEKALAAKTAGLATAMGIIESLEHELDPDGDKIHIPVDKCPDSKFAEGGPTAVNTFGCTELEAADSCTASSDRIPGEFEQYVWSDCPLGADGVDYTCAASLVDGVFKATECHETPYVLTEDGVKSYGG